MWGWCWGGRQGACKDGEGGESQKKKEVSFHDMFVSVIGPPGGNVAGLSSGVRTITPGTMESDITKTFLEAQKIYFARTGETS
jgi:hypothetical protein